MTHFHPTIVITSETDQDWLSRELGIRRAEDISFQHERFVHSIGHDVLNDLMTSGGVMTKHQAWMWVQERVKEARMIF